METVAPTLPRIWSYPQRIVKAIPLPPWLSLVLGWEILFLADYLITTSKAGTYPNLAVFVLLSLFFASVSAATAYCAAVLTGLYPNLILFVEEVDRLRLWYGASLVKAYHGYWPVISGTITAAVAYVSLRNYLQELTPAEVFVYRAAWFIAGFFFVGVALWALLAVVRIPIELARFKIKVHIHQHVGSGLQALGSSFFNMTMAITFSYLLIVIAALRSPYGSSPIVLAWITGGAFLIFGFFLLPQIGIHRIMARKKEQHMTVFSRYLEAAMERSLQEPSVENMKHLKNLFDLQAHLQGMNDWPFNMNSLWQLITALIIPVALAVMEIFSN